MPPPRITPDTAIVVMGVSGCGKSTLGGRLADAMERPFVEGDALHPAANVAKMTAGVPLTDDDRWPWLERVADVLGRRDDPLGSIVSCSALRRAYRDFLVARVARPVLFAYLETAPDLLLSRMLARVPHYMPATLLESQLTTLEPPGAGETALVLDASISVEALVAAVLAHAVPARADRDNL